MKSSMWPTSPEDAPTATGSATMEFESDGNGKFTTSSLTEHLADDTDVRRKGMRLSTSERRVPHELPERGHINTGLVASSR